MFRGRAFPQICQYHSMFYRKFTLFLAPYAAKLLQGLLACSNTAAIVD